MTDGVLGGVRREYLLTMGATAGAYLVAGAFLFGSYATAGFEVAVLVGLSILIGLTVTGDLD